MSRQALVTPACALVLFATSLAAQAGWSAPVFEAALNSTAAVLGGNSGFTTSNIDAVSPVAVTFFGDTRAALALGFLGAPGCFANIDVINGSPTGVNVAGTSVASFALPPNLTLIGLSLTAQSVCLTLGNPLNLYTSNGVEATLGL